ncbi:MAG TPA: hypothetical protein VFB72_00825 [Verrucomicrobiae bacterium]|nr:hypothetical protein [Verrucomicrobiae bacterium]
MKKRIKSFLLVLLLVVIAAVFVPWHRWREGPFQPVGRSKPKPPLNVLAEKMTGEQWTALAKAFDQKFKPAAARWFKAYAGHVPFRLEDVTLDKFTDILNGKLYTFMIGKTTLTFQDDGDSAKVVYMMTQEGARSLNTLPTRGRVPDLSVPVTSKQVLEMVKADRGVSYQPAQVEISPSAAATIIDGGAFVSVNKRMINGGELMDGKSFAMVFDKNGKLVNYEGPIF